MADTKKPSLTVLGGPSAGKRFVFQEGFQEVSVGSDEGSSFRLQLPGVSPTHARIRIDAGGVTIFDAGGGSGLHVNDNRVPPGGTTLRNGDIVWLGTPGEADVVMLQCILPRASVSAPVPAPPAPEPAPEPAVIDETGTVALEPETLFGAETVAEAEPAASAEPSLPLDQEFVAAEEGDRVAREPVTFSLDEQETQLVTPSPAPSFEEETAAEPPAFAFPEDSSTVLIDATEMAVDTSEPTVAITPEPEATVMASPEPEPTVKVPPPPPKLKPAPALPKPAAAPPPLASQARPAAPPRPATAPRPAVPPRPRPQPADRSTRPPARAASGTPTGRLAGLGIAALVVLGGGGWAVWRFVLNKPSGPAVQATPRPVTPAPASIPSPMAVATPPPFQATPAPAPVELVEGVPATAPPLAAATPTPRVSATPTPSPTAAPRAASATPRPASTGPSAETLRAQQVAAQVASLLGQAEAALAARQYDQAVGHLDEALRLDPQNARAAADRTKAGAQRDGARKRFVPGRTVVTTGGKAAGGLAGFDSVAVQKAPDFLGRIEFEMNPPSGIRPGDPYTLRFFLVNEGKKAIRIQGVTVNTVVNGAGSGTPAASSTKEVAPQQRARIGEVSGSWRDGTTSWSAEVLITATRGDSLKNQIVWR